MSCLRGRYDWITSICCRSRISIVNSKCFVEKRIHWIEATERPWTVIETNRWMLRIKRLACAHLAFLRGGGVVAPMRSKKRVKEINDGQWQWKPNVRQIDDPETFRDSWLTGPERTWAARLLCPQKLQISLSRWNSLHAAKVLPK
jgi:hypothetical protein